jgi:HAE1 family hydrophobic/amphiphilic exporter-1
MGATVVSEWRWRIVSIENQNQQGARVASLFVKRPVLALVLNLLIIMGGAAAFLGAEVRELPNVDQPVLSIDTDFNGASAETVDNQVTSIIEGAVARVQGISSISSSSRQSRSSVDMSFVDGTNIETATSDVRDALSRILDHLPASIIPTVVKGDPNAQPIVQLSVTSTTLTQDELTSLVDNTISARFAAIPGVADVQVHGEQAKAFMVDVNQAELASVGLTVADLNRSLAGASFDVPTGTLNGRNSVIPIRTTAPLATTAAFENILIKDKVFGPDRKVTFQPG